MLLVLGSKDSNDSGRHRRNLQVPQRKPVLMAGRITVSGGTPSVAIGGDTAAGGKPYN